MRLTDFFGRLIKNRDVVSVTGCGGKTSLIWTLAACKRKHKTLVTTTTHTQKPEDSGLFDFFFDEAAGQSFTPSNGITLAGNPRRRGGLAGSFSLSSFSLPALESIIPLFDYVFIEADGSRTLPLKAWAHYEPVITESTTISIGILPLWTLGKPVSGGFIHRLPLFTALSGASEGDSIKLEHYVPVISGFTIDGIDMDSPPEQADAGRAHSLFRIAKGKKILFFNQVEDRQQFENARRLVAMLPPGFRKELFAVIAGSIREQQVEQL
jgi:probable selenium-dependent hydroxylase accessory protein YqeC